MHLFWYVQTIIKIEWVFFLSARELFTHTSWFAIQAKINAMRESMYKIEYDYFVFSKINLKYRFRFVDYIQFVIPNRSITWFSRYFCGFTVVVVLCVCLLNQQYYTDCECHLVTAASGTVQSWAEVHTQNFTFKFAFEFQLDHAKCGINMDFGFSVERTSQTLFWQFEFYFWRWNQIVKGKTSTFF